MCLRGPKQLDSLCCTGPGWVLQEALQSYEVLLLLSQGTSEEWGVDLGDRGRRIVSLRPPWVTVNEFRASVGCTAGVARPFLRKQNKTILTGSLEESWATRDSEQESALLREELSHKCEWVCRESGRGAWW